MSLTRDNKARARTQLRQSLGQLAPLPAKELAHLESRLTFRRLRRGEYLTRAGDCAAHVGFVVSGLIRKAHATPRGKQIVRGFGGPGAVVGAYVSLLTGAPSYLSVEAIIDSELFVLRWSELEALYARHACFQTLGRRLAELTLLEREERAHELLTLSAAERYARFRETHRALLPDLRSYDIASYLGITPVSLSRLRARAAATTEPKPQRAPTRSRVGV
ncbi:MAG: Crp/Fnr family transcriptional regulator [Myxococcales bacterium]|nr:MAG: Crp/Fnr family transcriptional regulator [Myxococcales bacterium]